MKEEYPIGQFSVLDGAGENLTGNARTDSTSTDGARTDGARTDGAMTDDAMTDGARTDGARTDGARTDDARTDGAMTRSNFFSEKGGKVPSSRNFSFDVLRAIATVSVVALHAAGPVLYEFGTIATGEWWAANAIDSAVRFSVPIFLMLTGALLLERIEPAGQFLKRRFARLLWPFIFWSVVYLGVAMYFSTADTDIVSFLVRRLKSGASFHLWYVYMLIGIYLLLPVLQRWVAMAGRRDVEYFLILWLVALFAAQSFVAAYLPDFNLVYFSGYVGYPVLGYYLNRYFLDKKVPNRTAAREESVVSGVIGDLKGDTGEISIGTGNHSGVKGEISETSGEKSARPVISEGVTNRIAVLLVITGFLVTFLGTGWISSVRNHFDQTFYEYLSFNVIAMAAGVFLLVGRTKAGRQREASEADADTLRDSRWKTGGRWLVMVLSRYSYGIYLSHIFVLKLATFLQWDLLVRKLSGSEIGGIAETAMALHPGIGIPLLTVATTLVALGITVGLSKLPGGKYIAG